ncbi:putative thiazole-containing bacteriocin maturation protein [Bacillus sp. Xin]|uniref:putative thiazole-containing bacteriocin maturation protein n=1 Tax=unclassified Bacillus (in: firmicutes) TaxID=185979 RepID=UPI001572AD6E|nr:MULTISPECIES: putative thiazole-containing bacteriocin maturation protein [unclassified Bacillus (in: firmicutes)]MBC6975807.1 putative thiazole-containing bacteriocin maturation protein [Bacillus sp. Xin]NSW35190.1 putative thiazole-containing bacteriocin maturation protein [Bacillus sp. Xin1]
MSNLQASTKLKMNKDTFFIPNPDGGVYFRNNSSSFRMQGSDIYQWIEKLMPMFNGEHTLEELTNGLSLPYQNRVFEIGEILHQNGFVRDVSEDAPHQLEKTLLERYASQIEFLENFSQSSSLQFQMYRQAKVLAIGSGSFFTSLVSSLLESGLPEFHCLVTDPEATDDARLVELVQKAYTADQNVLVQKIDTTVDWPLREVFQSFDWILYVSESGNIEKLKMLHEICREEKKNFLPALYLQQVGLAGPVVTSDSNVCWESAWRRIHEPALQKDGPLEPFSSITGAMLANILVFELFKNVTGVTKREQTNQFFLLDSETLEGEWHSFIQHPLITTEGSHRDIIQNLDDVLGQHSNQNRSNELFHFFDQLTSNKSGIFHIWEEQDLTQLPLSQCRIQVANPLSNGPAELLPDIICGGLTHDEARREAGLTGIETYVSQMVEQDDCMGIGAGETMLEGVYRGLQNYLTTTLHKRQFTQTENVFPLQLTEINDTHCQFYFNALSTMYETPQIGIGEEVLGFPVVWTRMHNQWYGGTDLNVTLALRNSLQQALLHAQNQQLPPNSYVLSDSSIFVQDTDTFRVEIQSEEVLPQLETLQSALLNLKENNLYPVVFDLAIEPFLQEGLGSVVGVLIKEEEN